MNPRDRLWLATRSLRRRFRPRQYKETYINEAIKILGGSTYLEIGVRSGDSFRAISAARKIGVDPVRDAAMSTLHPGEEFFTKTSDDFFLQDAPGLFERQGIDVALVDGLHEFRQSLRDVLHLEGFMSPGGVIILDDCNPPTAARATDEYSGQGAWNGDVWKVAAYIKGERPDLRFVTIDADQGIGVVTGLTPTAAWPSDETITRYKDLPYEYLDNRRQAVLGLESQVSMKALLSGAS